MWVAHPVQVSRAWMAGRKGTHKTTCWTAYCLHGSALFQHISVLAWLGNNIVIRTSWLTQVLWRRPNACLHWTQNILEPHRGKLVVIKSYLWLEEFESKCVPSSTVSIIETLLITRYSSNSNRSLQVLIQAFWFWHTKWCCFPKT